MRGWSPGKMNSQEISEVVGKGKEQKADDGALQVCVILSWDTVGVRLTIATHFSKCFTCT